MFFKKSTAILVALALMFSMGALVACSGQTGEDVCEHTITVVKQRDATCCETGNFAYYKCTKCGEMFSDLEGKTPTTADRVTIKKLPHTLTKQDETVGKYNGFYTCSSCGGYFSDKSGKMEIPYSELEDSSVAPTKLPDLTQSGNILTTKTVNPQSDYEDISGDFTLRMFVGWAGADGKTIADLPAAAKVQVNYNLNRLCTLSGDGWYNFGIGYSKSGGLYYKQLQSGNKAAPTEFDTLFVQNNGLYVRVVRKGNTVSFYFEDKFGKPRLINSNSDFGTPDGTLIRLTANVAEGAQGWTPFVKNIEICFGIGNARCVFSK